MLYLSQKVFALLNQKYNPPISVLGTLEDQIKIIIDTENGSLFHISADDFYAFKDRHGNHWHSNLNHFSFEDKHYYPILGNQFILHDRMTISFTTKEAIVTFAIAYFELFLAEKTIR